MKDECGGKIIVEFASPRAKVYGLYTQDEKITKKCKGIKKYVIKKEIYFQDYKDCVFEDKEQSKNMNYILKQLKKLPYLQMMIKEL